MSAKLHLALSLFDFLTLHSLASVTERIQLIASLHCFPTELWLWRNSLPSGLSSQQLAVKMIDPRFLNSDVVKSNTLKISMKLRLLLPTSNCQDTFESLQCYTGMKKETIKLPPAGSQQSADLSIVASMQKSSPAGDIPLWQNPCIVVHIQMFALESPLQVVLETRSLV